MCGRYLYTGTYGYLRVFGRYLCFRQKMGRYLWWVGTCVFIKIRSTGTCAGGYLYGGYLLRGTCSGGLFRDPVGEEVTLQGTKIIRGNSVFTTYIL